MKKIIKSIIIVLILALVIFLAYKAYMFMYSKNIVSKYLENSDKNYIATVTRTDYVNNSKTISKYWNSDKFFKNEIKSIELNKEENLDESRAIVSIKNKEQNVTISPSITDDGKKTASVMYGNVPINDGLFETYGRTLDYSLLKDLKLNLIDKIYAYIEFFEYNVPTYIKSENYLGKDCYVLIWGINKYNCSKLYIEKDTYLPIVYTRGQDEFITYDMNLRTVTDEEINYPELSEYYTSIVYIEKNW